MSRNIRISRLRQAPGLGESTLGRNRKIEILAAKTTATKALLALILICSGQAAWSYTVSGNTYNTNGSQSDVQAACNAAPDNGSVTVIIPSGTFQWTNVNVNNSCIIQGTQPTTGATSGKTAPESAYGTVIQNVGLSAALNCKSSSNGHVVVKWIDFQQVSANGGAAGQYCVQFDRSDWNGSSFTNTPYTCLLHDCYLNAMGVNNYMVSCLTNGIIIWNCTIQGNSGFQLVCGKFGWSGSWNTPDTFGTQDTNGLSNTYIEDCTIIPSAQTGVGGQYSINLDDNSRCVFRNSTFIDTGLGSHGQESSPFGGRLCEAYNNTFTCNSNNPSNLQCFIAMRGGSWLIHDNALNPAGLVGNGKAFACFYVFSTNSSMQITQQTSYPAARQVGQGWSKSSSATFGNPVVSTDGTGSVVNGTYFWNNSGWTNPPIYGWSAFGIPFTEEGRDWFQYAKPGYTPYTYPHPLHSQFASSGGGGSSTPTPNATPLAPQNLRVN